MARGRRPGRGRQALVLPVVAVIAALAGCAGNQQNQLGRTSGGASGHGAGAPPVAGQQADPALARLKGLTGSELRTALGDPVLTHRDGPAQLWQYDGRGCVLEVYFYEDQGAFRVSYAEILRDKAADSTAPLCADRPARRAAPSVAEAAQASG